MDAHDLDEYRARVNRYMASRDDIVAALSAAVTQSVRMLDVTCDTVARRAQVSRDVARRAIGDLANVGLMERAPEKRSGITTWRVTKEGYDLAGVKPPMWGG